MSVVRAKFRVMRITHEYNGDCTSVQLLPVTPKSKGSTDLDGSEENRAFWNATPGGELEMTFAGASQAPFELGSCVYIDMERLEAKGDERFWKLYSLSRHVNTLEAHFDLAWDALPIRMGKLQLSITNRDAWKYFQEQLGTRWKVDIIPC